MPTLEIALVPVLFFLTYSNLVQTNAFKRAGTLCMEGSREDHQTVSLAKPSSCRTPGLLAMYSGFVTTHPGLFAAYLIWDSIHSHHKLQHSPTYGPFAMSVYPLLAGDIEVVHLEITDPVQLKTAMERPVLGSTVVKIQKGKVAPFLGAYKAVIEKHSAQPKHTGLWIGYTYEDP
jgi:hypothetical protein